MTQESSTSSSVAAFSSNWSKLKVTLSIREKEERKAENKKKKIEQKKRKRGGSEEEAATVEEERREEQESGGEPSAKKRKEETQEDEGGDSEQSGSKMASLTKVLAMDCEFVGVGEDGIDHMLARVSLVNAHGDCVYDKYVKPSEPVTDYRTAVSGIREENLVKGEDFDVVQKEIADMIEGHRMVGHAISNDFKVLHLSHPKKEIRDTSKYKPFRAIARTKYPSLKKLCLLILGSRIQEGEHDSITDARSTMQLYQLHKRDWETKLREARLGIKNESSAATRPVFTVQNGLRVENGGHNGRYRHQKRDHRRGQRGGGRKKNETGGGRKGGDRKTKSKRGDQQRSKSINKGRNNKRS